MPVVVNAGPLIALARIDALNLLPTLYGQVIVPHAVHREVTLKPNLSGSQDLKQASWLKQEAVKDKATVQQLRLWLDEGESEAIVLAQEMGLTLIMDEKLGRTFAEAFKLNMTGTLGVLLVAKTQGHILAITPLLDRLLEAGVRLSPRLYLEVQQLAGENT